VCAYPHSIILQYCYLSQRPPRNTSVQMGTYRMRYYITSIIYPCGEYNIEKRKINRSKVLLEHCSSHTGTWPFSGPRRYNIIVLYNSKTPKSSRRRWYACTACTCTYIMETPVTIICNNNKDYSIGRYFYVSIPTYLLHAMRTHHYVRLHSLRQYYSH